MKTLILYAAATLCAFFAAPAGAEFRCNECHSKNPALVRMHRALEFRGCPACHQPGSFGQKGSEARIPRQGDPLCMRCHTPEAPKAP